jgi:SAM-dependent methyltransferase
VTVVRSDRASALEGFAAISLGGASIPGVRQDERAPFVRALQRARVGAYAPGEFVGQESFMTAAEIRDLARRAGIARGVTVLDLCCGIGGPGRFIAAEFGCDYLGVDYSADAIEIARGLAGDLPCRFEVAMVPPVPAGPFEVVLLLETLLAFPDKEPLLEGVAAALEPGGRFACTFEAGAPLDAAERAEMPDADTVHLIPTEEMLALLERVGLSVAWQEDLTDAHAAVAESLTAAFTADEAEIAAEIGDRALTELLAAHRLWSEWMRAGRVRKIALIAEKR